MTLPASMCDAAQSASEKLVVELSWPAKQLSPNARVHHMVKHRYAKAAKTEACWAAKIALPKDFGGDRFAVHIRAYPPDRHARDADNLISSLKSASDGIAQALGVDDSTFNAPTLEWCDVTRRGQIVIILEPAA